MIDVDKEIEIDNLLVELRQLRPDLTSGEILRYTGPSPGHIAECIRLAAGGQPMSWESMPTVTVVPWWVVPAVGILVLFSPLLYLIWRNWRNW